MWNVGDNKRCYSKEGEREEMMVNIRKCVWWGGVLLEGKGRWGVFGGGGGEFRGGAADTAAPALALVCVPLAITCSARADVSTCHVGRRVTSE